LVAIGTAVAAAFLLFANGGSLWLRIVFGIPLALFLPGHALMLFVDPEGRLGGPEWFTLSVSSSIAVTTLLGMALASTPMGLTANAAVVALTLVTLLALFAAGTRTATLSFGRLMPIRRNSIQRATFGALALAACTLLVLLLTIPGAVTSSTTGQVVVLWGLRNESGTAVRIGANNVSAEPRSYRLTITQGGRLISEQDLELPRGTSHVFEVEKSATWTDSAPVVADLADVGGTVPTRSVSVWMTQ
jgi:hypothetical protein